MLFVWRPRRPEQLLQPTPVLRVGEEEEFVLAYPPSRESVLCREPFLGGYTWFPGKQGQVPREPQAEFQLERLISCFLPPRSGEHSSAPQHCLTPCSVSPGF